MRKIKDNKINFITSIICVLIPSLVGIILWDKLPNEVALRFDFEWNAGSYYSKGFAVFGFYLLFLAMHLLVAICCASENEKGEGIPDKIYRLFLWICPIMSILSAVLIYGNALGCKIDVSFWVMFTLGFLYLILGNYAPKIRRNRFAGVRIKWTFESKKNWEHTNRFSGYIMCVLGIIFIIMAFTRFYNTVTAYWMPVVMVVLLVISVFLMILYSGNYYLKHKNDEDYYDKKSN